MYTKLKHSNGRKMRTKFCNRINTNYAQTIYKLCTNYPHKCTNFKIRAASEFYELKRNVCSL